VKSSRKYVLAAVVAVCLAAVAAAQSGAAGGANSLASVAARLTKLEQRPTHIAITTPLKGKVPAGKTIDWLSCGVPACDDKYPPLKAAAAAVGWKVKFINEGLTPELVKAAWDEVVRDKPAAVAVSGGFPTAIFKSELAVMQKRGVPIVSYGDPSLNPVPPGLTAEVDGGNRMYNLIGKNFADWVAVKSNGKANVLYAYSSTYPVLVVQSNGYKAEIAKVCPACTTTYFDAPATSIGTDLASKIASEVQAHPDVNYVVAAFNDMEAGVPDALAGIGRTPGKDIQIITQDQNANTLADIRSGKLQATYVNPAGESMWQTMDVILRATLKQSITPSIDQASNTQWWVTSANVPAGSGSLNNVADYVAQFKKLWGVK
jgi:ABC-type sugar transport system substrate-binding protein